MVVGVYGLGRFGAFWAECLSKRFEVKGYSRSTNRAVPPGVHRVGEDEILGCDALFLCVAISAMEEVLGRISHKITNHIVIFDTCSVKMRPIELMMTILPEHAQIIGTHPMFGPDSGKDDIRGLPLCFCPVRVEKPVSDEWKEVFRSMGLRIHELSAEEHDREAAYTQGITHFVGRVLGSLKLAPSEISTVGYTKLLEIVEQTCNDPYQLFLDLQRFNPFTDEMRNRLGEALEDVLDALESPNLDISSEANIK
jgi:prephenate dehydrogenase